MEIHYWNRSRGREELEKVYGDDWIRLFYETNAGLSLTDKILVRPVLSRLYGAIQSSSVSRGKIAPFIRAFDIDMSLYEDPGFTCFNDFFIRKFRPGVRPIVGVPKQMAAPAEARYFGWESPPSEFPVKGLNLSAEAILGRSCPEFQGGPVLLARLCPVDYHRFHFPDHGEVLDHWRVEGMLHSVNPTALRARPAVFAINERQVTLLQTEAFGRLAYVEVGALCVGKIVQTHKGKHFRRGEEKGYFLFGGSTVILFGEPGKWKPSQDILRNTGNRLETLVELGTQVAEAL